MTARAILPTNLRDILYLDVTDEQQAELQFQMADLKECGDAWLNEYARTLWVNRTPVAVLGISPKHSGVAEVWALISRSGRDTHYRYVSKCAKRLMKIVDESGNYHRLQLSTRSGFADADAWAEWLGFEEEGPLTAYGSDGADYVRYGRVTRNVSHQ